MTARPEFLPARLPLIVDMLASPRDLPGRPAPARLGGHLGVGSEEGR